MTLKLINNLTKAEYELEVADKLTSGLFYCVDVVLPTDMEDGEYTYQLKDKEVVATGLCQVGEYVAETAQYNKKEKYVVYNG